MIGHGNLITNGVYDYGCITENGIKRIRCFFKEIAQSLQKILNEKGKVVLTRNSAINEDATSTIDSPLQTVVVRTCSFPIHTGFSRDPKMQGCRTFFYAPLGRKLAKPYPTCNFKVHGFTNLGVFKEITTCAEKISGVPSVLVEAIFLSNTQEKAFQSQKH
ncbi:MAG: N-acetylmuramoyl-L-alanine amidase [Caldisericia bacterium]